MADGEGESGEKDVDGMNIVEAAGNVEMGVDSAIDGEKNADGMDIVEAAGDVEER